MGVAPRRQVQHAVSGMQVLVAGAPVGEAGHRHLPNHGRQPAPVTGFDPAVSNADGVGHLVDATLARRAQVQVVLAQPAQHLHTVAL